MSNYLIMIFLMSVKNKFVVNVVNSVWFAVKDIAKNTLKKIVKYAKTVKDLSNVKDSIGEDINAVNVKKWQNEVNGNIFHAENIKVV